MKRFPIDYVNKDELAAVQRLHLRIKDLTSKRICGTLDGATAWGDGCIFESRELPQNLVGGATIFSDTPNFTELFTLCQRIDGKNLTPLGLVQTSKNIPGLDPPMLMMAEDDGAIITMNARYYAYFVRRYPGVIFREGYSHGKYMPINIDVIHNGYRIGICAPINMAGRTATEIVKKLGTPWTETRPGHELNGLVDKLYVV